MRQIAMWFLCCIAIAGGARVANAQWRAVFEDFVDLDTIYWIRQDAGQIRLTQPFYFPEYDYHVPLRDAYRVTLEEPSLRVWQHHFPINTLKIDTTYLQCRFYVSSLDSIKVYFFSAFENQWRHKKIKIEHNGYQGLFASKISDWDLCKSPPPFAIDTPSQLNRKTDKIVIVGHVLKKNGDLAIGDLMISNRVLKSFESTNPFFDDLYSTSNHRASLPDMNRVITMAAHHLPRDYNHNFLQGQISIKRAGGKQTSELEILKAMIAKSIELYPSYLERNLDMNKVNDNFLSLASQFTDDSTLLVFAEAAANFIESTYSDPHFKLDIGKSRVRSQHGPIRLYALNGQPLIAAVFDSLLATRIPLGSELIAINGVNVDSTIDAKLREVKSAVLDSLRIRSEIISGLLVQEKTSPIKISFIRPDQSCGDETIYYDRKVRIPDNFIPKQCQFNFDNMSKIAEIRINRWSSEVLTRILNESNTLRDSRAIIFDLRGNGGGDKFAVMQLLSLFIERPLKLYSYSSPFDAPSNKDSVVVAPNIYFNYPSERPIAILVDYHTACASEMFITGLKTRPRALVVGPSSTRGALEDRFELHFPSGTILTTPALIGKPAIPGIEAKGLWPDHVVHINSIEDLRPYRDKVFQEAMTLVYNVLQTKSYTYHEKEEKTKAATARKASGN